MFFTRLRAFGIDVGCHHGESRPAKFPLNNISCKSIPNGGPKRIETLKRWWWIFASRRYPYFILKGSHKRWHHTEHGRDWYLHWHNFYKAFQTSLRVMMNKYLVLKSARKCWIFESPIYVYSFVYDIESIKHGITKEAEFKNKSDCWIKGQ